MIRTRQRTGWTIPTALLAFAVQAAAPVASAGEVQIQVEREGEYVSVRAKAGLDADARTAWDVLTDYDRLADFIPDMKSSRVLQRDGNLAVVEQKGELGFLFFSRAVNVTMAVSEEPPRRIVARAIAGNLKDMEASYVLTPAAKGMELGYRGRFVPDFFLPPLIGMPIVRRSRERRLQAMVDEIERRNAASRGRTGPAGAR